MRSVWSVLFAIAMTFSASAAVIFTSNDANIAATGSFDWSTLGGVPTEVNNGFGINATGITGLSMTVSQSPSPADPSFRVTEQQAPSPPYYFGGSFTNGTPLLYSFEDTAAPLITFNLNQPVSAFGFYQNNANRASNVSGTIWAYDALNNLLATGSASDNAQVSAPQGTAGFLGVYSSDGAALITRVTYQQDWVSGNNSVISSISTAVPEPSTTGFLILGGLVVFFAWGRNSKGLTGRIS